MALTPSFHSQFQEDGSRVQAILYLIDGVLTA